MLSPYSPSDSNNVLLIDEKSVSVDYLKHLIRVFFGLIKMCSFKHAMDGLEALQDLKPEFLFLELNGPQPCVAGYLNRYERETFEFDDKLRGHGRITF